mmetsp:Transcript_58794/g.182638  ORF Transcript_58794/g.182638 Transcript_58794/m.182638 type:complete len:221 (+) Transcript_58794:387-1049(+)
MVSAQPRTACSDPLGSAHLRPGQHYPSGPCSGAPPGPNEKARPSRKPGHRVPRTPPPPFSTRWLLLIVFQLAARVAAGALGNQFVYREVRLPLQHVPPPRPRSFCRLQTPQGGSSPHRTTHSRPTAVSPRPPAARRSAAPSCSPPAACGAATPQRPPRPSSSAAPGAAAGPAQIGRLPCWPAAADWQPAPPLALLALHRLLVVLAAFPPPPRGRREGRGR